MSGENKPKPSEAIRQINPAVLPYLSEHWAMEPGAITQFVQRLVSIPAETRLNLFESDEEEDDSYSRRQDAKPRKPYQIVGGVAVLPLIGVLQKRENWLSRYYPSEVTSTTAFTNALRATKADPDVTCRVIYADSPGGLVDGTAEAADAVYAARGDGKPIIALSGGQCMSAAYWICSQAQEFYAGPDDWVGSIGTRFRLMDSSKMYEMMGLLPIEVTSGTYKSSGAEGLPVTDMDRAYFQSIVDKIQDRFTSFVARGRKLPVDDIRAIAKEARIYIGKEALASKLVDGIATPTEAFQRLQRSGNKSAAPSASSDGKGKLTMQVPEWFQALVSGAAATNESGTGANNGTASTPSNTTSVPVQSALPVAPAAAPNPLLEAINAAGIKSPEQFADLQKKASAFDEAITAQRTKTKELLVALFPDEKERKAEESVIDNLPAGTALDRYCKHVEAQHDLKLGTNGKTPAERLTQAPAASPKTISAELSSEEQAKMDEEVSASFDNSFGKKKG